MLTIENPFRMHHDSYRPTSLSLYYLTDKWRKKARHPNFLRDKRKSSKPPSVEYTRAPRAFNLYDFNLLRAQRTAPVAFGGRGVASLDSFHALACAVPSISWYQSGSHSFVQLLAPRILPNHTTQILRTQKKQGRRC